MDERRLPTAWQAQAPAPAWLERLDPCDALAAAAGFEPRLALVYGATEDGERLMVRAELPLHDGQDSSERIDALRSDLERATTPSALRAAPLLSEPDPAAHDALAAVVTQLEHSPAAGVATSELDPELRGWTAFEQSDGSFQIGFDTRWGLPFASLRAIGRGGCELTIDLATLKISERERANAAALAALRAADGVRGIGPFAHSEGGGLAIGARLGPPIDAREIALTLCAIESAALACAREVARLANDTNLARAYLAAHPRPQPFPVRDATGASGSNAERGEDHE